MRSSLAVRLRFFLPFAISAVFLLLVANSLRGEVDQLSAALASADWRPIVPAVALYFVGVWFRSMRWGLLLPEHSVRTTTLFRSLVVGFTVNNLLPLRMGEIARAYLLARWGRVAYGATVASLVVERVLDGLSLAVLLLASVWLIPGSPGYLLAVGAIAGLAFLACAAVLAIAAWRGADVTALVGVLTRPLPPRLRERVSRLTASFARSLALVHSPTRLVRLLGLSIIAWCSELGLFFVLMFSLGISGSYPQALLVGSAANFATLLPSSPGYAGTFDAALTRVARDGLSISAGVAGAYDIVVHATLFLPVVLVGTLVLWRSHMSFAQVTHAPEAAPYSPISSKV